MPEKEITFFLITSTVSMLFISIGLVLFLVLFFKSKKKNFLKEQKEKIKFNNELALVRSEVRDQTLSYIAQELHDNIGQLLVIANLHANGLRKESSIEKIEELEDVLIDAAQEIRSISKKLNSERIEKFGLVCSLNDELDRLKRLKSIEIELEIVGYNDNMLSKKRELLVFRIIQEFITNTLKYAKASSIVIKLEAANKEIKVFVKDNGIGFNIQSDKNGKGSGLINIESRAKLLRAQLTINSKVNHGTTLNLVIPQFEKKDGI